jgi:ADP-heptose:LPS heptosyltransferase
MNILSIRFIQRLFFACLDSVWIGLGQLIRLCLPKAIIPLDQIDHIIINRADRIGDAIISLPFLQGTIHIFRNMGWSGSITIIVSSYNASILGPLSELEGVKIQVQSSSAMFEYKRSALEVIANFIALFRKFGNRLWTRKRSREVLIDLIDSVSEMSLLSYPEYAQAHWISANRGIFTGFFDFTLPRRFAGASTIELVESYIKLFETCFWLTLSPALSQMGEIFYPPVDKKPWKKILIFVGVKEIRNFKIDTWRQLIHEVAYKFPTHTISVSDMKNHALLDILALEKWAPNVVFVRNTFTFAELGEFAAEHVFVVGVDGGDINVMRSRTNSLTIFTFGNASVWGPHLLGKTPTTSLLPNNWILENTYVTPERAVAKMYKKSFWLPAFQIQLWVEIVSDISIGEIVEHIEEVLNPKKNSLLANTF